MFRQDGRSGEAEALYEEALAVVEAESNAGAVLPPVREDLEALRAGN